MLGLRKQVGNFFHVLLWFSVPDKQNCSPKRPFPKYSQKHDKRKLLLEHFEAVFLVEFILRYTFWSHNCSVRRLILSKTKLFLFRVTSDCGSQETSALPIVLNTNN